MTNRTAATRYARATLDVALKEHADVARIESELAGFAALLEHHAALQKVLNNPAVPTPRKHAAVSELLKHVTLVPQVGKLLLLLASRDRLVLLPDIVQALKTRLMDLRNEVRADVTTAAPLSAERVKAIEHSLARATGRTVMLTAHVDPAIIGGIVARIGSTVYDGSVTSQLQRLKARLNPDGRG